MVTEKGALVSIKYQDEKTIVIQMSIQKYECFPNPPKPDECAIHAKPITKVSASTRNRKNNHPITMKKVAIMISYSKISLYYFVNLGSTYFLEHVIDEVIA